ncbi:hypothetical protein PPNK14_37510 [Pectobacterium parmentieri]
MGWSKKAIAMNRGMTSRVICPIIRAGVDQTVAASLPSLSGETGGGEESPGSTGQGAR